MLFAFFPLYVLDGMLDLYTAGLHMWEVPKEPFVILLEEEPCEATLAGAMTASGQSAKSSG